METSKKKNAMKEKNNNTVNNINNKNITAWDKHILWRTKKTNANN